jgi:hypothetical protein
MLMNKNQSSFTQKFHDPRWIKKRTELLHAYDFTCVKCGAANGHALVHRIKHVPHLDPWNYPDHLLQVLCRDCQKITILIDNIWAAKEGTSETITDSFSKIRTHLVDIYRHSKRSEPLYEVLECVLELEKKAASMSPIGGAK